MPNPNEIRLKSIAKAKEYYTSPKHLYFAIDLINARTDEQTLEIYHMTEHSKTLKEHQTRDDLKFPYVETHACEVCNRPHAQHFNFNIKKPKHIRIGQCRECFNFIKSAMKDFGLINNKTVNHTVVSDREVDYTDRNLIARLYKFGN